MFFRQLANEAGLGRIAERLHEFRVDGLLIIGGFEVGKSGGTVVLCRQIPGTVGTMSGYRW